MKIFFPAIALFLLCILSACNKVVEYYPDKAENKLSTVLEALGPENQAFTIDAARANTLQCSQGTELRVPANAFVDSNGNLVQGNVELKLKQVFEKGDMILNNRPTVSNGSLLESGGEFNLQATAGGSAVKLANGKQIEIRVPVNNTVASADGMQVFVQGRDSRGNFTWIPVNTNLQVSAGNYIFTVSTLQWVNIDKYIDPSTQVTNITVTAKDQEVTQANTQGYINFKGATSVANLYLENGKLKGEMVPVAREAVIIIIHSEGDKIYLGRKDVRTAADMNLEVELKRVTREELTEELKSLG
jgi:hypothetical protein